MKKLLLIIGCLLIVMQVFSQSDVSGPGIGHQRAAGRFVGWSPTAPYELS